jgi:hypothetical protein
MAGLLSEGCSTIKTRVTPIVTADSITGDWFASCSLQNRAYLIHFENGNSGTICYFAQPNSTKCQSFVLDRRTRNVTIYRCSAADSNDLEQFSVHEKWCGIQFEGHGIGWNESFYAERQQNVTNALNQLSDAYLKVKK